jgi:fatty-acyl-CoA synthase
MSSTLVTALRHAAELDRADGGIRLLDRREQATWHPWSEVRTRALRAAGALREAGVKPGDRVALILPTSLGFFDAYFGCQHAGAIPVPLYPPVRLGRLDEYIDRSAAMLHAVNAVALVTDSRTSRVLGRLLERAKPKLGLLDVDQLQRGPEHQFEVQPDSLAMVQFSSGTTVDPKPVALTHAQVLANAERVLEVVFTTNPQGQDPEPAGVSWLPLYHDMGLIGAIFPAILAAGPITLLPPEVFLAKPALWLRAISRYRGTISPAPNFAYALCVERVDDADLAGVDLSSWSLALNGAEPIAAATLRAFQERFAPHGFRPEALMPVYGLSEAALAVTFSHPTEPFTSTRFDREALARGEAIPAEDGVELVSVGRPLRDYGVEIRSPKRGPLAHGRIGHLWVSGPSLMRGYLGRIHQPIIDGWLDTGDLGFLHAGQLYITGRAKDVLILRGRNHAPQEVERAVDAVPGVRTGCTVAVADIQEHGERLLVFVEIRDRQPGQAEACGRAILAATGLHADLVLLLEPGTLPRTSSGKLRRSETLARWRDGTLTAPRSVTTWMLAGAMADSMLGYLQAHWARRGS